MVCRNGLDHTVPDCLSRSPATSHNSTVCDEAEHFENKIFAIRPTDNSWLSRVTVAQQEDAAVSSAIKQLRTSHRIHTGRFKRLRNVHLDKDILMQGKKIVLPLSLRYEVVHDWHQSVGHAGAARTLGQVTQNYVWAGMHSYVEDFCAHCPTCLESKGGSSSKEPVQPYTLDELKPRSVIAFDVATLPWVTNQYRYFFSHRWSLLQVLRGYAASGPPDCSNN